MQYWKNDLRTDLLNKVPTNASDPAFWQHMVTFTVGLGVTGSRTTLPSGSESWPDPTASDAAKIDDLWHAAVNGRGAFFSAADPTMFANALSNTLSHIIARTGSASAVASQFQFTHEQMDVFTRRNLTVVTGAVSYYRFLLMPPGIGEPQNGKPVQFHWPLLLSTQHRGL